MEAIWQTNYRDKIWQFYECIPLENGSSQNRTTCQWNAQEHISNIFHRNAWTTGVSLSIGITTRIRVVPDWIYCVQQCLWTSQFLGVKLYKASLATNMLPYSRPFVNCLLILVDHHLARVTDLWSNEILLNLHPHLPWTTVWMNSKGLGGFLSDSLAVPHWIEVYEGCGYDRRTPAASGLGMSIRHLPLW